MWWCSWRVLITKGQYTQIGRLHSTDTDMPKGEENGYDLQLDVLAFLGPEYHNFVYLPAQNTRGGNLVAWRDGFLTVDHWRVHQHSVSIKIQESDQPAWWLDPTRMPINRLSWMSCERLELCALDHG